MRKPSLLLASALLMFGAVQLHADEVKLTTALPAGENFSLALNPDLTVELVWGNGEKQTVHSTGALLSIPVKHENLTITSTVGKITSLYVQGNKISSLNLSGAENLKSLFAADNELKQLSLTKNEVLETVDLQDNQLTSFVKTRLTEMKDVNLAGNLLENKNLRFASSARLTHLVVADNQLTGLPSSANLRVVQTLWAQNNLLTTVSLNQSKDLRSVSLSNNQLKSINLAETPMLKDFWVDHNELTTLDLSKGSPVLYSMAANDNRLTQISWDFNCKKTCKHVYVQNNSLFINSMPSPVIFGKYINFVYEPQNDYVMEKYYGLDKPYDFSDLMLKNGWGLSTNAEYEFTDDKGQVLKDGEDFDEASRKFTFKTIHTGVVLKVTNKYYSFKTTPFNIGTTQAVEGVTVDGGFEVSAAQGVISVKASAATPVRIFNAAGICVVNETVEAGNHAWTLGAGIYVVNGKKVLVP